jgi:hypothetical protein
MPSVDLLWFFQKDLRLETQWWVSGKYYAKTYEVCIRFHNELMIAKVLQDGLSKIDVSKKENLTPTYRDVWGERYSNVVL